MGHFTPANSIPFVCDPGHQMLRLKCKKMLNLSLKSITLTLYILLMVYEFNFYIFTTGVRRSNRRKTSPTALAEQHVRLQTDLDVFEVRSSSENGNVQPYL